MFNIGAGEMVFILVAALLVLGPSRLPEMARAIGKFMREFRRQTDDVRVMVEREFYRMDEDELRKPAAQAPAQVPAESAAGAPVHAAPEAEPVPVLLPAPHAVARGASVDEEPSAPVSAAAAPQPPGEGKA
jgi:sec-independent protein translocase protein TatB